MDAGKFTKFAWSALGEAGNVGIVELISSEENRDYSLVSLSSPSAAFVLGRTARFRVMKCGVPRCNRGGKRRVNALR